MSYFPCQLDKACKTKLTRFFGGRLNRVSRAVIEDMLANMCRMTNSAMGMRDWSKATAFMLNVIGESEFAVEMQVPEYRYHCGEEAAKQWLKNPEAGLENPPVGVRKEQLKENEEVPDGAWRDLPPKESAPAPAAGSATSSFRGPEGASALSPERLKQILGGVSLAGVATQLSRLRDIPAGAPIHWAVQQLKPGMMQGP